MSINQKKVLAEQIKAKLNSPEYVAMPDLITYDDGHGNMLTWLWGRKTNRKENWISGLDINPGKGNKHKSENIVCYDELEQDDWEEIVNLIEKRNEEKRQIFGLKKKNIEQKLNRQSNLYYYWGPTWRKRERNENADVWVEDKGMRGYVTLLGGQGNGFTYHLYISEDHSVLNNFPFQTGYYSVETSRPIEKRTGHYNGFSSTGGESNPFNWTKFVEAGDQITLTPYEITDKLVGKPDQKEKCATCGMEVVSDDWIRVDGKVYHSGCDRLDNQNNSKEVINQGNTNTKNKTLIKSSNKEIDIKIVDYLLQYFQQHNIKKIKLVNGELVIEYNGNETISQTKNNQELQLAKNIIQTSNKQELTREALNSMVNVNTNSTLTEKPKNNNGLWIGCGLGGILIIGVVIGLAVQKQRVKNK